MASIFWSSHLTPKHFVTSVLGRFLMQKINVPSSCIMQLLPAAVVALKLLKFSCWSSFPPESSIAELQPQCTVTDSTAAWGLLGFQLGRKRNVCHTLVPQFIYFFKKRGGKKSSANFISAENDTKSEGEVYLQPPWCSFFLLSQIISRQSFDPFKDDLRFLRAAFFHCEEGETITVDVGMCSDVNLWCRLNLWVNIKEEGSYNLLYSSFCSRVCESSLPVFQFFLWFPFSFHALSNICQKADRNNAKKEELIKF